MAVYTIQINGIGRPVTVTKNSHRLPRKFKKRQKKSALNLVDISPAVKELEDALNAIFEQPITE